MRFVFLICTERSGSNFVTSLVGAHSKVSGPPPTHLFRLFVNNRLNYGDLYRDDNWNTLIGDVVRNFDCKLGTWNTRLSASELLARARQREVAELLRLVYEAEAGHEGASVVFVKENHTYVMVPYLLEHFSDARLVWMVRDPRDVASSWVSTDSIPGGVERAVDTWVSDQGATLRLYRELESSGRILRLRYEDLVQHAESALDTVFRFLELDAEPVAERFFQASRTRANAQRIAAWENLRLPVLRDNVGKFRGVLGPVDQAYVELACFELMEACGYGPELVRERPRPDEREERLAALRPRLDVGRHVIESVAERAIRCQRMSAIDAVLSRRLPE